MESARSGSLEIRDAEVERKRARTDMAGVDVSEEVPVDGLGTEVRRLVVQDTKGSRRDEEDELIKKCKKYI